MRLSLSPSLRVFCLFTTFFLPLSLFVLHFILIWLFADQRVTSDWVCPPPAAAEWPARNRIGCKFLQFAFRIWHLRFAFECGSRASYESFIHSLCVAVAADDDSSIDLHWFAFQLHFFDTLQWIILQLHHLNAMRCAARRGDSMRCDLFMAASHFKCICCCCGCLVGVVGVANNEAFVCNCLRLMIALELWQTDDCGAQTHSPYAEPWSCPTDTCQLDTRFIYLHS